MKYFTFIGIDDDVKEMKIKIKIKNIKHISSEPEKLKRNKQI
jgi:hypothetical protein